MLHVFVVCFSVYTNKSRYKDCLIKESDVHKKKSQTSILWELFNELFSCFVKKRVISYRNQQTEAKLQIAAKEITLLWLDGSRQSMSG